MSLYITEEMMLNAGLYRKWMVEHYGKEIYDSQYGALPLLAHRHASVIRLIMKRDPNCSKVPSVAEILLDILNDYEIREGLS